ncbi:MAG: QcrA and Rieske domain-containing protein [Solirubrobacteraceae bacterium]
MNGDGRDRTRASRIGRLAGRIGRAVGVLVAAVTAWRTVRGRGRGRPAHAHAGLGGGGEPGASHGPDRSGGHRAADAHETDPSRRTIPANRHAETLVAGLLLCAALLAFGFTAIYITLQTNTQLLGLAMGGALALLAAAAIVAGKLVVPQETAVEERGELLDEELVEEVVEIIESGGEGISRRVLLTGACGLAGVGMVTAVAAPLASLGPPAGLLHQSPWARGIRLVDDQGKVYAADQIQIGSFYTALPEGQDWESFGAGLLVVRLAPEFIELPPARRGWAPEGIMAFSKICPHAGCAISLYRYPTYPATSTPAPAFTCPCHYSTFTPGDGGKVIFGPAGRPLPQLPLMVDADGHLRAAGRFDEDIGPSWWGVRRT